MASLPAFPPNQLRAFHIGGYWRGPNDMVRQMMLGLRSAGATVFEYNTDEHLEALDTEGRPYDRGTYGPVWLRWEALCEEIEAFAPHLIICNAGGLSFRPADAERLRRGICILGIALSDPDVFEAATSKIAPNFDFFLTNATTLIPEYEGLGVPSGLVPPATNGDFFHPAPPRTEYACDVLVVGLAHPDRIEPVQALVERFETHIYGEGWEPHGLVSRGLIFGEDLLSALNSAHIVIIFFRMASGYTLPKIGLFDFLAAGALVATNYFPFTERFLTFGEDLVGFTSTEDLVAQVRYYLDHPEEARRIRQAGRKRVLAEYSWRGVWPRLLESIAAVVS